MSFSLEGRVAIITGASRGIGQAIAEAYVAAGAKVVIAARKLERIAPVAEALRAQGGDAVPVVCHTGDSAQIGAMVQAALDHFGRLDVVVNNAGTNPHFGPLLTASDEVWAKTFDTNVIGYMRVVRTALPALEKAGGGKVINIASIAGLNPMPGLGVYAVTKAAAIQLTKVLAQELAPFNVQVNAIAPGVIKTRFSQVLTDTPEIRDSILRRTPANRMGKVEDVTGAAVYLASAASDYTTGTVMVMDGGYLLGRMDV